MAVLVLRGQEGKQVLSLNLCFHTITSEQITLSTDITDHIVEDHTTIQDHITVKPRVYTMRGLISEKIYEHPDFAYAEIPPEPLSVKLAPLKTLAPTVNSFVQSAINAYEAVKNKVIQVANIFKNIASLYRYFRNLKTAKIFPYTVQYDQRHTKWSKDRLQKEIIELLDQFRINRVPVSVDTGWGMGLVDNFYITDIQVSQGDTYQQSELSVTVKELRFATTETRAMTADEMNRCAIMEQQMTDTVTGSKEQKLISDWARDTDANNNRNN